MNGETMLSDKEALKKLFVGGIPIPLTDKEFTAYFKNYGEVADSVIIKDSTTKKSRGFGFITFTNYQDLNGVLQSRPHSFDNKEVEVKRAIPRENNSDTAHIRCKKLFVGGVPKDGDEEQLKSDLNTLYGHCGLGTVTKVDFIKDRESGKNKGYGFIEVDSEDLADLIIIYDHKPKLNGKLMEIKKAEERGAKRGAGVTRGGARVGGRGGRGGGGGGGYGGYSGGEYGGASESYSGGFGGPQDSFVGGGGGGGGYGGGYRDSSYGGGYSNGGGYGSGQSYGGGAGGYGGGYGGSAYGEGASGYGNTPTGGYGDYGMGNSGGYGQQTSGFGPSRGGRSSGGGGGGSGGSGGGRRYQPY